ncbi:hypothetical protein V6Z11_A09G100400 [Gossypium hirsutum]
MFIIGVKKNKNLQNFSRYIAVQRLACTNLDDSLTKNENSRFGFVLSRFTDLADPSSSIFYFGCTEN